MTELIDFGISLFFIIAITYYDTKEPDRLFTAIIYTFSLSTGWVILEYTTSHSMISFIPFMMFYNTIIFIKSMLLYKTRKKRKKE